MKMQVLELVYKYQMQLGDGSCPEALTHELYKRWEFDFEILVGKGLILCSYSKQSEFKSWSLRSQACNPIAVRCQDNLEGLTCI